MSEKNKSIQDKMKQLAEQVEWFQGDEFALEQAVDKYQAAEKLAAEIEADLTKLKNDIKVVGRRFDRDE